MSLADKVVLITGATGGIGSALATTLAAKGCKIGLLARNETRLREIADSLQSSSTKVACAGTEVAYACADVGERAEVAHAVDQITQQLGPIDLLIANAGVGDPDQIEPFDGELFERLMRVNWLGMVNAIQAVLPAMLERRSGHITTVSSLRGYRGLPGFAGYGSTKAAVNHFMDALRVDLRGRGVAVTTVCPGYVRTAMTDSKDFPMPFIMEPEQAAKKIVYAIERKKKVFNFPWQLALMSRVVRSLPDWAVDRVAPR
ncbi:SDR family NAD(P)-dependent oxidoreductase [Stieleria varia]|uniref:Putative oxidoreductase n=1 Tax=Stieleria varia TaxID=2528005 RepID=A0A5C6A831_9BACT|nr:SDR family NAD(P)-dependent oxidoreductase [Stieleria varia]TWT94453.1 putative oxidoreductase [Stieleria varia]